ncbi:hypothetical protein C8J57DRAFT_1235460 [Mycena rebaudengoi]|nr:hypothetical protein C8J57DRAFT_1235460 [Mycena rebaudengoi]
MPGTRYWPFLTLCLFARGDRATPNKNIVKGPNTALKYYESIASGFKANEWELREIERKEEKPSKCDQNSTNTVESRRTAKKTLDSGAGYDWANEMRYLQRSSKHGCDGEIYIPEPTQQDEMKRVYLRRPAPPTAVFKKVDGFDRVILFNLCLQLIYGPNASGPTTGMDGLTRQKLYIYDVLWSKSGAEGDSASNRAVLYYFNQFDRGCDCDANFPIRQFDTRQNLRDQTEIFNKPNGIFVKIELFCASSTRFGVMNGWGSSTDTPMTRDTAPLFAIDTPLIQTERRRTPHQQMSQFPVNCVMSSCLAKLVRHTGSIPYTHVQSAHPRYWDDVEGAPINLSEDFSTKIAISWEELNAMGIAIGLSTDPSANSLLPKTRGTKHSLAVTDENPAKCRRF